MPSTSSAGPPDSKEPTVFNRPKPPPSHQAGRLAIVVTAIRADDHRRDEKTHPETVERHVPLSDGVDREYAFTRAAMIHQAFAPAARDRYRVKVVAR
jgi:hypothetical protein